MLTPEQITSLCDQWCQAALHRGSIMIGRDSERCRLVTNGAVFHQFDYLQLATALVGLTRVLLLPGLNTIIHEDHILLWSWCGQLVMAEKPIPPDSEDKLFRNLHTAAIRAALANAVKPITRAEFERRAAEDNFVPTNAKHFLRHSTEALAYLAFPLLEAVLKRACHAFVQLDGTVIASFAVSQTPTATQPAPGPKPYTMGKKISSLRDLLHLHHEQVASISLKSKLNELRAHFLTLNPSSDAYDAIYRWRNDSLHGNVTLTTIGGALLNLSLLISLARIEHEFDKHNALAQSEWQGWARDHDNPWHFYPPY